jgi:hypothetical protein
MRNDFYIAASAAFFAGAAVLPSIKRNAILIKPLLEPMKSISLFLGMIMSSIRIVLSVFFLCLGTTASAQVRSKPSVPIPTPIFGVTTDAVDNIDSITAALAMFRRVPTTRIVFDEFIPAANYRDATVKIRNVSYVMGEILDSLYVKQYSVDAYVARTREYLAALGDVVDIWEVGNEINGEWLGITSDVVAKMTGAFDIVKAQGKSTELTLYYNAGCYEKNSNEMFTWAASNIPVRMQLGLDYVLISYYEDDCNGVQPNWQDVFIKLHGMFPNSKIGFGEIGTSRKSKKVEYINRYYGMRIDARNYVGGYFWWYFKQDMVPYTKQLWSVIDAAQP